MKSIDPNMPMPTSVALRNDVARMRFLKSFGGMISVQLADGATARRFAESMTLFQLAESLGGVESLVCYPAEMTHASVKGTLLEVRLITANEGGALVELERGVEGVVSLSEMTSEMAANPEAVKAGTIVSAQVIRIDEDDRRVMLSLRSVGDKTVDESMKYVEGKQTRAEKRAPVSTSGAKLGDVLRGKLDEIAASNEKDD